MPAVEDNRAAAAARSALCARLKRARVVNSGRWTFMKIALDTNVLAYAEGANGTAMRDKALELRRRPMARIDCSHRDVSFRWASG
jgi:hypothetical protein